MMLVFRGLYLILIGYLIYTMVKRGGCCGHGQNNKSASCCDEKDKTVQMK